MNEHPLPDAWINRINRQFPEAHRELIAAMDRPPIASLRWHPRRKSLIAPGSMPEWTASAAPVPWSQLGVFLSDRPLFTKDPLFHAGAYYVQEASSMFLEQILPHLSLPDFPMVLDACAAPGGKSTLILEFLNGRGFLLANEVVPHRARTAAIQLSKWGYANFGVSRSPLDVFQLPHPLFDLVVADAPCSGEGMFRKTPHARSEWTPEAAEHCALRQSELLDSLWPSIRPGGFLIYSTCTFNPAENEYQLERLLTREDAEPVDLSSIRPSEAVLTAGGLAFLPHLTRGEGFFVAVVRKKVRSVSDPHPTPPPIPAPVSITHRDETWQIHPFSQTIRESIPSLQWVQNGWCSHGLKGRLEVPHQHAAWQLEKSGPTGLHSAFAEAPQLELTQSQALQYLKGWSVDLPAPKGWVLVQFAGLPLGWAKSIGHRLNNHYIKSERIAMDL